MNTNELCSQLVSACAGGMSAIRTVVQLVPAGGDGDKVAPPTHKDGQYAFETRVVEGRADVRTVLLDSVQSQANRFEDTLLNAVRRGEIVIPLLEVNLPGRQTLTSLSVPHRVHDAIFRDSQYKGLKFRESESVRRWYQLERGMPLVCSSFVRPRYFSVLGTHRVMRE